LNIITTSLKEIAPRCVVGQVDISYQDRKVLTPDYTPQKMMVSSDLANHTIGIKCDGLEHKMLLERMRHEVEVFDDRLLVNVPSYRNDIMHERDLHEDIAIAYGYHNIAPTYVRTQTFGQGRDEQKLAAIVRDVMIGMGYTEVITLILLSPQKHFDNLRLPPTENHVVIENPVSQDQSIVRQSLIPGLLETFSHNINNELPQLIFEVGEVTELDAQCETGAREILKVAVGIIGPKVGFTDMKQTAHTLLHELDARLEVKSIEHPTLLSGRAAEIIARKGDKAEVKGMMGEVHPEVLANFNLVHPVAVLEMELIRL
jgi:phenylalanyl-tRNA synthetase beta chain